MADEHDTAHRGEMAHTIEQFKTRETFEKHVRNQIATSTATARCTAACTPP